MYLRILPKPRHAATQFAHTRAHTHTLGHARDPRMYKHTSARTFACVYIRAVCVQVALEAEEEALRLKHNELHLKSAAAQEECQRTVSECQCVRSSAKMSANVRVQRRRTV